MRNQKSNPKLRLSPKILVASTFTGILAAMTLYGCTSNANAPAGTAINPTTQPATFALFGPPPKKSGVQLWSENCARCHNMRPPDEFSSTQWSVIGHHMRLRANLTGEEEREIVAFLQASH